MNPEVLVLIANGSEELEAITIVDLLRRAQIGVTLASIHQQQVVCARKTTIVADTTIDKLAADRVFSAIILPGGLPGADYFASDERVQALLARHHKQNKLVGAICAAPKALHQAKLLKNRKATAYPGVLAALNDRSIYISEQAVELDSNILTSRGPGTAIEFALKIIALLLDEQAAQQVKQSLT